MSQNTATEPTAAKTVRKYVKIPKNLPIPVIPTLPVFYPSELDAYRPEIAAETTHHPSGIFEYNNPAASHAPFSADAESPQTSSFSHTQPRLRVPPRNAAEKHQDDFERMDTLLKNSGFDSIGHLLSVLFYNHKRNSGNIDPRSATHAKAVSRFLSGRSEVKMSHIINLIYHHPRSKPSPKSQRNFEREMSFCPSATPSEIHHARPCLSTWATHLVGDELHLVIGKLGHRNPSDPNDRTQLRAQTNRRSTRDVKVVTWDDISSFSVFRTRDKYMGEGRLAWFVTDRMAGPTKSGVTVVRKRRPHTMASHKYYLL
jgi:hypothetical protein